LTDLLLDEENVAVRDHLLKFEYLHTRIHDLATADFRRIVSELPRLQEVVISDANGDAEHFLRALLASQSSVRCLTITGMTFTLPLDTRKVALAPQLMLINLSQCTFSVDAFVSILAAVVQMPVAKPIALVLRSIVVEPEALTRLAPVEDVQMNIAEFDFSGNSLPASSTRCLFQFLFAQKKLRLLSFEGMKVEAPIEFLKNLLQFVTEFGLIGLEISGDFEPVTFSQFLHALGSATCLRRLVVRDSGAGAPGVASMAELVTKLPLLTDVGADGFRPGDPHPFFALWTAIGRHPSVKACDSPVTDAKTLGVIAQRSPPDYQSALVAIGQKLALSTARQRAHWLAEHDDPGAAIFDEMSKMNWVEENPDADKGDVEVVLDAAELAKRKAIV
jgi:hypothetical protein